MLEATKTKGTARSAFRHANDKREGSGRRRMQNALSPMLELEPHDDELESVSMFNRL